MIDDPNSFTLSQSNVFCFSLHFKAQFALYINTVIYLYIIALFTVISKILLDSKDVTQVYKTLK